MLRVMCLTRNKTILGPCFGRCRANSTVSDGVKESINTGGVAEGVSAFYYT